MLLDRLREHAEAEGGDEPALHFRVRGRYSTWSWIDYLDAARSGAACLRRAGLAPGDALVVVASEAEPAVRAVLGAWAASVVPTPVGLPWRGAGEAPEHLRAAAATVGASVVIAPRSAGVDPSAIAPLRLLIAEEVFAESGAAPLPSRAAVPALAQLTSGSTGRPRAAVIPHDRLAQHVAAMGRALPIARPGAVGVSWLPLYHDMGLVGCLLFTMHERIELRLSTPSEFRRNPMGWLDDMSRYRAIIACAPPSAWALAVRLRQWAYDHSIDLSHLRCALVGAEPISARVLATFADAFAPCGFHPNAFFPVYGLAEATLAVTFPDLMAPRVVDRVDPRALGDGCARPSEDPRAPAFVGLGRPLHGTEVRVVDERGAALPERAIGEVTVRADTLMDGYLRDPAATAAALRGGWLRTGDLGYLAEGRLFVTGRSKDLIIRAGQKLMPSQIEDVAETVEGIRPGCVAAVGVWSEELATERAVILAEVQPRQDHDALREAVRERLAAHGIVVDEVRLLPASSLPRTTSGKLVRPRLRALAASPP